jgi:transcriptional regulator with XRE-family HTH domain
MKIENSDKEKKARHWTAESDDAFAHKLAFDFIAQIENQLELQEISRTSFAHRLGVTPGSVSQVLNNPQNLTIKTIAKYCQGLGQKAALIVYQTRKDSENNEGPISPEVFKTCWQRWGEPQDFWQLDESDRTRATTRLIFNVQVPYYSYASTSMTTTSWSCGSITETFGSNGSFFASTHLPVAFHTGSSLLGGASQPAVYEAR